MTKQTLLSIAAALFLIGMLAMGTTIGPVIGGLGLWLMIGAGIHTLATRSRNKGDRGERAEVTA